MIIAPNPVEDSMNNCGISLTETTFVIVGLGGITFNIRPSSSKNLIYSLPALSDMTSSFVYPSPGLTTAT